ncbi:MAG: tRNA epoxyqueuosine(34) reductase QueG [Gammaproteobacteria bacterium]|nr:tRNA epoxyqueuosine(34) reductase QueG [Gammaproteobacteria bacterium]
MTVIDYHGLAREIKHWAAELGFQQLGIADTHLGAAEQQLDNWLAAGCHGDMGFMAKHGRKRSRPELLVPGTLRVLSVRMNYLPPGDDPLAVLNDPKLGYISRYALGRDYHRLMRNRLQKLAVRIRERIGEYSFRAFVDSAPVLEKPLGSSAGLGWQGKHTNLLSRDAGCWFFLGELYTDLPLPVDKPADDHCGRCTACLDSCPTRAITAPYRLDARRCISYLTIEFSGSIPVSLRPLMGNRIYGCDDCLLACPWNRFALPTAELAFHPRNGLESPPLDALIAWSDDQFRRRLEGSPIRRIGIQRWRRNIAVALGNAVTTPEVIKALERATADPSSLVAEHAKWALDCHRQQPSR